jgi:transaldolase
MQEGLDATVAGRVRQMVLAYLEGREKTGYFGRKPLWSRVRHCGSELWLDTGDMEEAAGLWCSQFSGLTTNNTLLNKEVQKGIYDGLVGEVAEDLRAVVGEDELPLEIAFVLNAVHGLRLSRRFGARVSVELHTDLSHDVARTEHYGRRFYEIAPDRFIIKVPLTPAGLLAARRLSDAGVPVNYTLGFSARQNYLITNIARPAFVNVFLGRLNAFVADSRLGDGAFVGEKAVLASQRCVRELREEADCGTRQIAASMRDAEQVASLAGVDVLTMPTKVARGFEEMGLDPESLQPQFDADPEIGLSPEVDREALGIDCLWDVPEEFRKAVLKLAARDPGELDPGAIVQHLADKGFGDLLPDLSTEDLDAINADGKIPSYERWQDRLASREVGLDALMNLAGLASFTADQRAMDERIRGML